MNAFGCFLECLALAEPEDAELGSDYEEEDG